MHHHILLKGSFLVLTRQELGVNEISIVWGGDKDEY